MKLTLAILLLALPASALDAERIADAIYRVEGSGKARVPYGILTVKVKSKAHARQVCLNTIRNSHRRWLEAGQPGAFLDHLANRYCPPSTDPIGNRNWRANIKSILKSK